MFENQDDLEVLSNDLSGQKGFTLCSVVRNESYFLPAFLSHYRALGVERFIFLDDHSSDGTREHLFEQKDVMVVGSGRRFGEAVSGDGAAKFPDMRAGVLWRSLMMSKYCGNTWALCLDADEFISLPPRTDCSDLLHRASGSGRRAVYGVMLDVYPRHVADLHAQGPLNLSSGWSFDALQHLRLREDGPPLTAYAGARARLLAQHGVRQAPLWDRLRARLSSRKFPKFNNNAKPVLLRWGEQTVFHGSHRVNEAASTRLLLPIRHFKFTSEVHSRVKTALEEGMHWKGSAEYDALAALLSSMAKTNASFHWKHSRPSTSFDALADSKNAIFG